ncbi:hypothetical protein COU61_01340, partial [Candidatus Pacearchaeota archaeon CG10_big_fil_rev_8_21_14_0_10_35_13]
IFEMFKKPQVDREVRIEFPKTNYEKIKEILNKAEFSVERINKQTEKIKQAYEERKQKTLF